MKSLSTFGILAIAIASVSAQDASDADVAIVRAQLADVVDATTALDNTVLAYTGPADSTDLVEASYAVVAALTAGLTAVTPIQGFININQAATQLLDQVNALNTIVDKAVTDVINQKPLLVSSCLGPTVLGQLQQQLASATAFRDAIASKFTEDNRPLVNQVSQGALDSLSRAITDYSDQTSLPPSCQTSSSSAAAASTSTPPSASSSIVAGSSSVVVGSSTTVASSSIPPASSSAGASTVSSASKPASTTSSASGSAGSISGGTTGAPPTRSASASKNSVTTTTTTICVKDVCTQKAKPTKTKTVCHACEGSSTTSPAKYTGAASVGYTVPNVLALLAIAAGVAV